MATNVNVSTEYNGAYAGTLFVQAFKGSDTIQKGAITVLSNIISAGHLPNLTYSSEWAARSCGWNPTGDINYTEKEIQTKQFEIQHEICKNDFRSTYENQKAGLFGNSEEIPSSLQASILDTVVANFGEQLDGKIWGATGGTGSIYFSGLIEQLDADSDVIDVTAATTSITAANVIDELGKVYDKIPAAIENDPDLVWVVSSDIAKAYKQAQAAQVSIGNIVGDKVLDYLGHEMIRIDGLPAKTMVVYRKSNLGFLTGIENELNTVRLIDTDATLGDGNVRILMRFNVGVGYSLGSEIVYYS